jgi:hypothetical protein
LKLENVKELRELSLREVTAKFRSLENVLSKLPISFGLGDPENVIVADIGSLHLRLDGGVGTTLYIKESGDETATGWVAK